MSICLLEQYWPIGSWGQSLSWSLSGWWPHHCDQRTCHVLLLMQETCNFSCTHFLTPYSSDKQLVAVSGWGKSIWSYLWQTKFFLPIAVVQSTNTLAWTPSRFSALWYPFHSHFLYKLFYIRCRFRTSTACRSFNCSLLLTTCHLVRRILMFPPDKKTGLNVEFSVCLSLTTFLKINSLRRFERKYISVSSWFLSNPGWLCTIRLLSQMSTK